MATQTDTLTLAELTEQNIALAAQVQALVSRVEFLERYSPHVEAARKDHERAARVAKAKAVRTVSEFKALTSAERAAFSERATADQLVMMLKSADADERKLVLDAAPHRARTVATIALAPAPHVVEVTSTVSLRTSPLEIDRADVDRLAKLGLPASTLLNGTARLAAFSIDRETPRYYDADSFDALLELDEDLVAHLDAGRIRVRRLSDDQAREQALQMHTDRVNYARDLQRSDRMPELPTL